MINKLVDPVTDQHKNLTLLLLSRQWGVVLSCGAEVAKQEDQILRYQACARHLVTSYWNSSQNE